MKNRRNLFLALGGLLAIVVVGVIIAGKARGATVTARVKSVTYTTFTTRLPETGTIQRPSVQTLTAWSPGTVERVLVTPGQRVTAGEALIVLSNPQLTSNLDTSRETYRAAAARADQTGALTPANNRSSLVQAEFNLEQARSNLKQAITDEQNGAQSGLGYGGSTAEDQRISANANVANADTNLREAKRIYEADQDLYANKAISKDALSQSQAKFEQAQVADDQAKRQRDEVFTQLRQNVPVLRDRARAAQDQVRQAEAALTAARLTANQQNGDIQASAADAAARLSELKYAQDQVDRLTIRSPFAGVVETIASQQSDSLRPLQPGDQLSAGQSVATVASGTGFVVRARVDEQDIAHVFPGQPAEISGEDLGAKTLAGRVIAVGAVAQKSDDVSNTSRQVLTTIALEGTLPFLRDGMTVDVDIITARRPHVLVVPNDAIARDTKHKPYVYVVRDGRAVKSYVVLGQANESDTIVRDGVKPGDTIVAESVEGLADGSRVNPAPSPSPSATSSPA